MNSSLQKNKSYGVWVGQSLEWAEKHAKDFNFGYDQDTGPTHVFVWPTSTF